MKRMFYMFVSLTIISAVAAAAGEYRFDHFQQAEFAMSNRTAEETSSVIVASPNAAKGIQGKDPTMEPNIPGMGGQEPNTPGFGDPNKPAKEISNDSNLSGLKDSQNVDTFNEVEKSQFSMAGTQSEDSATGTQKTATDTTRNMPPERQIVTFIANLKGQAVRNSEHLRNRPPERHHKSQMAPEIRNTRPEPLIVIITESLKGRVETHTEYLRNLLPEHRARPEQMLVQKEVLTEQK